LPNTEYRIPITDLPAEALAKAGLPNTNYRLPNTLFLVPKKMKEKEILSPAMALEKLQKMCSMQEKCPADIMLLLKRWGVEPGHHEDIISRLKSDKFIDEGRYAAAFVKDKVKFDHWGFLKIIYFLKQKGIPRSVVDEACKSIDRNEYAIMIKKELEKKKKTLTGKRREVAAKLARYGSSRGYEMEIMHPFLGDVTPEE
jgi:regulatory protein